MHNLMNQPLAQLLLCYIAAIAVAGSLDEVGVDASAIRTCQVAGASALACELRLQQPLSTDPAKAPLPAPWWNNSTAFSAYQRRAAAPRSSTVNVGVKDTVPKPQAWSHCAHCALEVIENDNNPLGQDGDRGQLRAILFDPRSALRKTLADPPTLSSSKWRGFFHTQPEGAIARFAPSTETFANAIIQRSNSSNSSSSVRDQSRHPHQHREQCQRLVTRPVFVFSILTWQVGHLLVDVLEPLHATMVQHYGRIPTELSPVLVFEVANDEEQHVLLEKLISDVWERDTPFSLLKVFVGSAGAVHTTNALRQLLRADAAGERTTGSGIDSKYNNDGDAGLTCFTDLHLGLDISKSYYAHGFDRHNSQVAKRGQRSAPLQDLHRDAKKAGNLDNFDKHVFEDDPEMNLDETDPEEEEVRQRYSAFRAWLWLQLGWSAPEVKPAATVPDAGLRTVVSVVRRISTRSLLNHDEVLTLLQKHFNNSDGNTSGNEGSSGSYQRNGGPVPPSTIVRELTLEKLTFTEQAVALRETDVLVCQYGSAAHNVLFMKPGSVLVLLMQPHWCKWAWAFASQATLLDIHVWIYCDEPEQESLPSSSPQLSPVQSHQNAYRNMFRARWHEQSWLQGPWFSKDESFAVDLTALQQILQQLSTHHTPIVRATAAITGVANVATSAASLGTAAGSKGCVRYMVTAATKATRSCSQRHYIAFAADSTATSGNETGVAALLAAQESTLDAFAAFADDYGPVSWDSGEVDKVQPLATDSRRRSGTGDLGWRVHIGNVTVEVVAPDQGDGGGARLKIKLVPEVVFDFEGSTSASSVNKPLDFLQSHSELVLCSEVIDPSSSANDSGGAASCHGASTFAEFSTLDLHMNHAMSVDARGQVVYRNPVVLHAWLAQSLSATQYESTTTMDAAGGQAPNRPLPGSDTYFPVSTGHPPGQLQHRSDDFACGSAPLRVQVTLPGDSPTDPHTLEVPLWTPAELQRTGAVACSSWKLQPKECAALVIALAEHAAPFAAAEALGLPPPQHKPTPSEPFVFLHHEKCAGTSLRRVLARSALQATGPNTFHIPCFDPIDASGPIIDLAPGSHRASCMSFDLTPVPGIYRDQLAVLGGHFAWGVWHQRDLDRNLSMSEISEHLPEHSLPNPLPVAAVPRVFLMLREPISRVVSLYYERLEPQTQVPLNALSENEFAFYLENFRGSAYGRWRDEGFQNAACKMLCDLHTHKGKEPSEVDAAAAATQVNTILAVARLQLCVVGLTHRWEDTKRVFAFWFPWVDFAAAGDVQENTSRKSSSAVETRDSLKPAHLARIISANQCDLAVYAAAEERFDLQLQALSTTWA